MVGEMTNRPMARFVMAGLRSNLDDLMHRLVSLNAIDIIDFDGEEGEEFSLGSPRDDHEEIAKQLNTYRSISSWISPENPSQKVTESTVREWLSGSLGEAVSEVAKKIETIEELTSLIGSSKERVQSLKDFSSLGIDLDLLDGYQNATSSFTSASSTSVTFSNKPA